MADNSYPVALKIGSANGYYTRSEAIAYYGERARGGVQGVTYHWWNRPLAIADTDHDNIVNMMYNNFAAGRAPTVNYVASLSKGFTLMASPDLVTWCSGNGNASTVSVECSPHLTEAFYKQLGWLHDQLEQRYRKTLAIYVHKDWAPTECSPINKQKIRDYANEWKERRNVPAPLPAPAPVPDTVTVSVQDIANKKVRVIRDTNLWDLGFMKYSDAKSVKVLPAGTILEASAIASHPTGSKYYLSEYSFQKGIKNGFNVKDCEDYVDVVAPVPTPPKPAPAPVPVEVPLTTEQRLTRIEKFLATLGLK